MVVLAPFLPCRQVLAQKIVSVPTFIFMKCYFYLLSNQVMSFQSKGGVEFGRDLHFAPIFKSNFYLSIVPY